MSSPVPGKRYLPLDGVRGIAVALVIIHHAFYLTHATNRITTLLVRLASSCWIGVDLFFVLSGYLITGILLRSKGESGYFRIFYMRRFLRIFPLYYGCLLTAWLAAALVRPDAIPRFDFGWNLTYLANLRLALHGWAWRPVSHLWSLSVEEQFYLVWPTIILLLPRRRMALWIACLFGVFAAVRYVLAAAIPLSADAVFGVLHLDGLLLGAALAALHLPRPRAESARTKAWAVFLAAAGILLVEARNTGALNWHLWHGVGYLNYSLVALCGAAAIALSVYSPEHGVLNRLLAMRPLVEMGKYSYAMYVLHYPLDTALRALHLHPSSVYGTIVYTLALGAGSFAAALITWKLIEERCIRLKDRLYVYAAAPEPEMAEAVTAR